MIERRRPDRKSLQEARDRRRRLRPVRHYDLSARSMGLVERVKAIDWFAAVGRPVADTSVSTVLSAGEAKRLAFRNAYINVLIEASNEMSSFLAKHHPTRYDTTWNESVNAALPLLQPTFDRAVALGMERLQVEPARRESLREVVQIAPLSTIHEIEYSDVLRAKLGMRMVEWYERGHWPCGFEGTWPSVQLVVY